MFRRDWTMCWKYVNHSRLKSQHNAGVGGVCNQVMTSSSSPLEIHINLGQAPNCFAIKQGFSIHNCRPAKFWSSQIKVAFHNIGRINHLRLLPYMWFYTLSTIKCYGRNYPKLTSILSRSGPSLSLMAASTLFATACLFFSSRVSAMTSATAAATALSRIEDSTLPTVILVTSFPLETAGFALAFVVEGALCLATVDTAGTVHTQENLRKQECAHRRMRGGQHTSSSLKNWAEWTLKYSHINICNLWSCSSQTDEKLEHYLETYVWKGYQVHMFKIGESFLQWARVLNVPQYLRQ